MEEFKQLIFAAFVQTQSEQLDNAQKALYEYLNERTMEMLMNLLQIINQDNLEPRQAFIIIVILDKCIDKMIIPISFDRMFPEIQLDDQIIDQILTSTMNYFIFDDILVKRSASSLVQKIISTIQNRINDFRILDRLIPFLTDENLKSGMKSALKCFRSFSSEENKEILFENILPIIQQILANPSTDPGSVSECLNIIANFDNRISQIFSNAESLIQFMQNVIMSLHNQKIKKRGYRLIHIILFKFPNEMMILVPPLFEHFTQDLVYEQKDIILYYIFQIIDYLILFNENLDFDKGLIYGIMPQVLLLISKCNTEILDAWDPSKWSRSTLKKFIRKLDKEQGIELVRDYIIECIKSDDPSNHEAAFKLIHILITTPDIDYFSTYFDDTMQILLEGINSESIRIIYYSIIDLSAIAMKIEDNSQVFSFIFESYKNFMDKSEKLCVETINLVSNIVIIKDFNQGDELIEFVQNSMTLIDFNIRRQMTELIRNVTKTEFNDLKNGLLDLFIQIFNEVDQNYRLYDTVIDCLELLIPFANDEFNETALQLMNVCVEGVQSQIPQLLSIISALIVRKLPSIMENVGEFYQLYVILMEDVDNEDLVIEMFHIAPKIIQKDILGPQYQTFLELLFNYYSSVKGCRNKERGLHCFGEMLLSKPCNEMIPFVVHVMQNLDFIVQNLAETKARYGLYAYDLITETAQVALVILLAWPGKLKEFAALYFMKLAHTIPIVLGNIVGFNDTFTVTFNNALFIIEKQFQELYQALSSQSPHAVEFIQNIKHAMLDLKESNLIGESS